MFPQATVDRLIIWISVVGAVVAFVAIQNPHYLTAMTGDMGNGNYSSGGGNGNASSPCADKDGDGICDADDTCDDRDRDGDGKPNEADNCPDVPNASQADFDNDGTGDACAGNDVDGDGCLNPVLTTTPNPEGTACVKTGTYEGPFEDLTPTKKSKDTDGDGKGDECDPCIGFSNIDSDGDKICDGEDNCSDKKNADQKDKDFDGTGDACDTCDDRDKDSDGHFNDHTGANGSPVAGTDNCPEIKNSGQTDINKNKVGDHCDSDADGDGCYNYVGEPQYRADGCIDTIYNFKILPGEDKDPAKFHSDYDKDGTPDDCDTNGICGDKKVDKAAGEECDPGGICEGEKFQNGSQRTCQLRSDGEQCVLAECAVVGDEKCSSDCKLKECPDPKDPTKKIAPQCAGGAEKHCSDGCKCDLGYPYYSTIYGCYAKCGDGYLRDKEECDDGNSNNGDGCTYNCTVESKWTCQQFEMDSPSECTPKCGNGTVDYPYEYCDEGDANGAGKCTKKCDCATPDYERKLISPGTYKPDGSIDTPSKWECVPKCGDGKLTQEEKDAGKCDDGNVKWGDGCYKCEVEPGWTCTGEPSKCTTPCINTACTTAEKKYCTDNGLGACKVLKTSKLVDGKNVCVECEEKKCAANVCDGQCKGENEECKPFEKENAKGECFECIKKECPADSCDGQCTKEGQNCSVLTKKEGDKCYKCGCEKGYKEEDGICKKQTKCANEDHCMAGGVPADNPCGIGRECTSLANKDPAKDGACYECGECKTGYKENADGVCVKQPECPADTCPGSPVKCDASKGLTCNKFDYPDEKGICHACWCSASAGKSACESSGFCSSKPNQHCEGSPSKTAGGTCFYCACDAGYKWDATAKVCKIQCTEAVKKTACDGQCTGDGQSCETTDKPDDKDQCFKCGCEMGYEPDGKGGCQILCSSASIPGVKFHCTAHGDFGELKCCGKGAGWGWYCSKEKCPPGPTKVSATAPSNSLQAPPAPAFAVTAPPPPAGPFTPATPPDEDPFFGFAEGGGTIGIPGEEENGDLQGPPPASFADLFPSAPTEPSNDLSGWFEEPEESNGPGGWFDEPSKVAGDTGTPAAPTASPSGPLIPVIPQCVASCSLEEIFFKESAPAETCEFCPLGKHFQS